MCVCVSICNRVKSMKQLTAQKGLVHFATIGMTQHSAALQTKFQNTNSMKKPSCKKI